MVELTLCYLYDQHVNFAVGDLGCIYKYTVGIGDFNAHVNQRQFLQFL